MPGMPGEPAGATGGIADGIWYASGAAHGWAGTAAGAGGATPGEADEAGTAGKASTAGADIFFPSSQAQSSARTPCSSRATNRLCEGPATKDQPIDCG